jgi:hypothetical protein
MFSIHIFIYSHTVLYGCKIFDNIMQVNINTKYLYMWEWESIGKIQVGVMLKNHVAQNKD